jgi:hypothetical protein
VSLWRIRWKEAVAVRAGGVGRVSGRKGAPTFTGRGGGPWWVGGPWVSGPIQLR